MQSPAHPRAQSCEILWPDPTQRFSVRPLQAPTVPRHRRLQELVRLFEQDTTTESRLETPHSRAQTRLQNRGHSPSLGDSRAEPLGGTWPPPNQVPTGQGGPGARPSCSVREQVQAFELRFGPPQAPCMAAAPHSRGGQGGGPGPARAHQSWCREQKPWPPWRGGQLPGPSALRQPQPGSLGASRDLSLTATRAGADPGGRARLAPWGLPQAPSTPLALQLGQAGSPQAALELSAGTEVGASREGQLRGLAARVPRCSPAPSSPVALHPWGPPWSCLAQPGPFTSSPIPTSLPPDTAVPRHRDLGLLAAAHCSLGESDREDSDSAVPDGQSQHDHRSFTLSLAELCDWGLDRKEAPQDEGARAKTCSTPLNSSMSSASLIPATDVELMLEEAKRLGEETLQHLEDIHVIVLHKEDGTGLGFSLAGGTDQHRPVTIHRVFTGGLAARDGSLQPGDEVLSINGHPLGDCSHAQALWVLHRARAARQAVVVLRRGSKDVAPNGTPPFAPEEPATVLSVQLMKDSGGLGFSLAGGRGSLRGDQPLTVQRVFLGEALGGRRGDWPEGWYQIWMEGKAGQGRMGRVRPPEDSQGEEVATTLRRDTGRSRLMAAGRGERLPLDGGVASRQRRESCYSP
ncbi:PREDICTED: pro-interleukin-16-like [Gavialis gangeticus]|uniref:pro-interleukin-16-like n=1 Tax=Gavialis gangeticus TaxID=94835 RepID=UPI00092F9BB6|nr:PREDICTED: pro-interleukin-16-like [Gavialis gangeticus]